MSFSLLIAALSTFSLVHSCADHTGLQNSNFIKRQEVSSTNPSHITTDWAYDASYNWGAIQEGYATCQSGTQQSPIPLSAKYGLSRYHLPTFSGYDKEISGSWGNWGYGPAFNLTTPENNDYSSNPAVHWDNEVAYLKGWHLHAPADHPVDGLRSRAEVHLVHVDNEGHEKAVLAIRLDPGTGSPPFFSSLPPMVSFRDPTPTDAKMVMEPLLESVHHFNEFWTYRGSLTSPPCKEGIRWFVAGIVAYTSADQMQAILGNSTFSAREEQQIWLHEVNGGS